jgi:predicted ATP-dependent endonuclease of OLD family
VFRGAFLLRRAEELKRAVVLVDEPELSLHPAWQQNILQFYDDIVSGSDGTSSQVIVATHSPFIVHGSPPAKHIVLHRNGDGRRVMADPNPSYPSVSAANVAVTAFDLVDFVRDARGKRTALIVEGPTDKKIIEEAWRKLRLGQSMPFSVGSGDGVRNIPRLLGQGGGRSGPCLMLFRMLERP